MIQYTYSGGSNGIECSDGGTAALTRTMSAHRVANNKLHANTRHKQYHTEVVDGLGNYAEYDFVNISADPHSTPYLINHKQYQGNTSGPLLISEQSCLNGATPDCTGQTLTSLVYSIVKTSTLNGAAVKQSAQTINWNTGMVTDDIEYDYGSASPGPELSEVQTAYLFGFGALASLPTRVTTLVPSGGGLVAVSTVNFGYDGNTLTTTSGLPQHNGVIIPRGNLTSIQYTTGASSPSSITAATLYYDDAGQVRQS